MNPVICDTNIFIELFKKNPVVIAELSKIGNPKILMPSISKMELITGMRNKEDLQQMIAKIKHFNILHLNEITSVKAIDLIADFRLSHGLKLPDALIGAMALSYDLELFTFNLKDFRYMPNIKLYSFT